MECPKHKGSEMVVEYVEKNCDACGHVCERSVAYYHCRVKECGRVYDADGVEISPASE